MKKKRDGLLKKERKSLSSIIEKKVFDLKIYKAASSVMFYAAHRSEVETGQMIKKTLKSSKQVCVPKVNSKKPKDMFAVEITSFENDLEPGNYGIFEPNHDCGKIVSKERIDLVIVPALAYDRLGYRLGYGKGYYDRWLKGFPKKKMIGLAFDFQILENVPRTSKDVPVNLIVTEKRVVRT
ncbi:MAG: 5-formyltetrahydrofolate cyclo-ligase [Elusimicrobia bacterium]|nr:5-formyltetrahydrofolate cyclo-ligase [Elusimicrobiota bacterium]